MLIINSKQHELHHYLLFDLIIFRIRKHLFIIRFKFNLDQLWNILFIIIGNQEQGKVHEDDSNDFDESKTAGTKGNNPDFVIEIDKPNQDPKLGHPGPQPEEHKFLLPGLNVKERLESLIVTVIGNEDRTSY